MGKKIFQSMLKYIKASSFVLILALFGTALAQEPDAFIVKVEPSSFEVWQTVDLTIKAIYSNGEVVRDYEWDVFIDVEWIMDADDYVVPSDGLYTFLPQDQWVKLFSKWLEIKTKGTHTIAVSDIIDDGIKWETTVIVGKQEDVEWKDVNLVSPAQGAIERNSTINVVWSSIDLPNSPVQVLINDVIASESMTSERWDFNINATWAIVWENKLQVKIVDINGVVLGQTKTITFTYQPITDDIFHGIYVSPDRVVKQWDQVTFSVDTADSVTSAELRLSNGQNYPMDRLTAGNFTKKIVPDFAGSVDVSLVLIAGGNKRTYTDVENIIVEENITVRNIKFYVDGVGNNASLNVTWEAVWQAPMYRVYYGLDRNNLNKSVDVSTTEILIQNLDSQLTYYFKIQPLDASKNMIWTASDVTEVQPGHLWSQEPACVIRDIDVMDSRIWDKRYLVWESLENATKYNIYRSEFEAQNIVDMQKIWETVETRYEYPFDKFAGKNEYAYFVVEAECADGSKVQVDNVKKVQVWPKENIMLFIIITLLIYSIYRLNYYAKD